MADVLKNWLAYFLRGFTDCLYGYCKLYEYRHTTAQLPDHCSQEAKETKSLSVLAQRRATKKPPKLTEGNKYDYTQVLFTKI